MNLRKKLIQETSGSNEKALPPGMVRYNSIQGAAAPTNRSQIFMLEKIRRLSPIHLVVLVLLAFGGWAVSLRGLDLSQMNDLGLVSILPPAAFVSLAVLSFSFCLTLYCFPQHTPLILLHLLCMIFMLHGAAPFLEELPRFGPAWRHVGIIEYIMRNASIDPKIDAYFNWPGFFITSAMINQAAGLESAQPLLKWAPIFFELLYLAPLWLIFKTTTQDRRLIWFGIWLFYMANWVGQDYYSPQALNYFFFLVIVYILLRWLPNLDEDRFRWKILRRMSGLSKSLTRPQEGQPVQTIISPRQGVFLFLVVALLFWVSVSSHQLTPFAIFGAVFALALLKIIRPRSLPLLMVVLIGIWFSYMASTYLNGRIDDIVTKIGQVDSAVSTNLTDRLQGSTQHLFIVQIRLLHTLIIWAGALFGALFRWRKGHLDIPMTLLIAAPGPLVLLQSYGGEMLIRAYFFSLPFAAFFVAALFFPSLSKAASWKTVIFAALFSASMIVMFFFTRYGNERMDYFNTREFAAVQYFYQTASPGALLASAEPNMPYKYQGYEKYKYIRLENTLLEGNAADVIDVMDNSRAPEAYLILTRSQIAQMNMFFGLQPTFWSQLEGKLQSSGRMRLVYQNEDARIYQLIPKEERQ